MKRSVVLEIISFLLAALFVYAAVSKLLYPHFFEIQLSRSPVIHPFAREMTWILPFFEILIGIFLMIRSTQRLGIYLSFITLSLFTIYLLLVINFAKHVPCSCGGIISGFSWVQHIFFNLFFIILSFAGIRLLPLHRNQAKSE